MLSHICWRAIIPLLLTLAAGLPVQEKSNLTAESAAELALIYAYPLLAYRSDYLSLTPRIGVNNIGHARHLNTASTPGVVKPNVDTLYSSAIYDVSHQDLIVKLPPIPSNQYVLVSFHDLYGNNFAVLGQNNLTAHASFRLSRSKSVLGINGTVNAEVITSPTTFGVLLVRWLVKDNNLNLIHALQNRTTTTALPRLNGTTVSSSPANPAIGAINWNASISTPAQTSLKLLCQVGTDNLQGAFAGNHSVRSVLAASGVCSHNLTTLTTFVEAANTTANTAIAAAGQSALQSINEGWSSVRTGLAGQFGSDYGLRAEIARTGYLMLQAPYAIYPSWSNHSTTAPPMEGETLQLGANESYIYTFSCKPPVQAHGFWSLTAYDAAGYLIDNPLNVYSLGDRSNITYSFGAAVYGAESNVTQDGPFQLLVQPADVLPPSNWTSNWLPGPAGGGNMTALLRWFNASDALLDGSYQYPVVTRQGAITQK